MNLKWGFGMLLFFMLVNTTHAEHVIQAYENQRISASIAKHALNRVFIEGDRIKDVRGLEGEYTLHQDDFSGDIYLHPTTSKPIQIFLLTEHDKHYQLKFNPVNGSAETVHLIPTEISAEKERTAVFEKRVISAIRKLARCSSKQTATTLLPLTFNLPSNLKSARVTAFDQNHLLHEIYVLNNFGEQPFQLNPADFDQSGIVAISFKDAVILPHSNTSLYVIRNDHVG